MSVVQSDVGFDGSRGSSGPKGSNPKFLNRFAQSEFGLLGIGNSKSPLTVEDLHRALDTSEQLAAVKLDGFPRRCLQARRFIRAFLEASVPTDSPNQEVGDCLSRDALTVNATVLLSELAHLRQTLFAWGATLDHCSQNGARFYNANGGKFTGGLATRGLMLWRVINGGRQIVELQCDLNQLILGEEAPHDFFQRLHRLSVFIRTDLIKIPRAWEELRKQQPPRSES